MKLTFVAEGVDFSASSPKVESVLLFNSDEEHVVLMQRDKKAGSSAYIERDDQSFGTYDGVKEITLFTKKLQIKLNAAGKKNLASEEIIVNLDLSAEQMGQLKKSLQFIFEKNFKLDKSFETKSSKASSAKGNKGTSQPGKDYSATKYLNLESKNISALPDYVSEMKNLETVKLNYNPDLDPEEVCSVLAQLPCIKELEITPGKKIPSNIGNLKSLEKLSMTGITGTQSIPSSIGNLKKLTYLYISTEGDLTLPEEMGKLSNLETFLLTAKKWNLPAGFNQWVKLTRLSLSNCDIRQIPESIIQLKNVKKLFLGDNPNLDWGQAMKQIAKMKNLEYLQLSTDKIPKEIGECRQIKELRIVSIGSKPLFIPEELWSLGQLQKLDLGGNSLAEVSEKIGMLASLQSVSFYECGLKSLPESMANLKELVELNVSENPKLKKLPKALTANKQLTIYQD